MVFFILLSLWEQGAPRRPRKVSRLKRWPSNILVYLFNSVLLQLLTTTTIANLAYIAWKNKWGFLNHWPLTPGLSFCITFLMLDLVAYAQHVLFHKIPYTWLFHRMHHSDLDVDVTTGPRFHPFESVASFLVRQGIVLLMGPSVLGIIAFDSLIMIFSFFNHANIRLFGGLDLALRWLIVTPDMHRIHHSTDWAESNSNFGFIFPWWDHLLRTYRSQPKVPHEKMNLGLAEFQSPRYLAFPRLLTFPFLKKGD